MSAAIFCPHCKLKYDKAVRLRRHRDFWICSSCAEHYTAETLATACENAARSFLAKANYLKIMAREGGGMKIDIWKRPWLAVLLLLLCFLLVGYFERQDQELFERMAPVHGGNAMNWTDDAYGEEHGPWTDEELMIAAGNVAFARNRRKHTETEECGE